MLSGGSKLPGSVRDKVVVEEVVFLITTAEVGTKLKLAEDSAATGSVSV